MVRVNATAKELLRRVRAAGLEGRFQLREVCPRDAGLFLVAFDRLLDGDLVERVAEGPGRWHYRLTPDGRAAAESEGPLRFGKDPAEEAAGRPTHSGGKTRSLNCAGGSFARRKSGRQS